MPTLYSESEVDVALCIFDMLVDATQRGFQPNRPVKKHMLELFEQGGTPLLRSESIRLTRPVENAWLHVNNTIPEEYLYPFDLEFVPDLLERAIDGYGKWELKQEQWNACAEEVVRVAIADNEATIKGDNRT